MPRPQNRAETVTITISTTRQVEGFLQLLVDRGTHGKNVAEAAERWLANSLDDYLGDHDIRTGVQGLGSAGLSGGENSQGDGDQGEL